MDILTYSDDFDDILTIWAAFKRMSRIDQLEFMTLFDKYTVMRFLPLDLKMGWFFVKDLIKVLITIQCLQKTVLNFSETWYLQWFFQNWLTWRNTDFQFRSKYFWIFVVLIYFWGQKWGNIQKWTTSVSFWVSSQLLQRIWPNLALVSWISLEDNKFLTVWPIFAHDCWIISNCGPSRGIKRL